MDATMSADQDKFHPSYVSPDADLILLSDDGIKFRAHSLILSQASKFFREMFGLPRPEKENPEDAIPIGESSLVTKAMLDIIYPGETEPRLPTREFEFVRRLLSAAERFGIDRVNHYVRLLTKTGPFINKPLEVYVLACAFGWDDEAHGLSLKTLTLDLTSSTYAKILKTLDATSLYNLFELRWERKRQILCYARTLASTPINEIGGCDCDEENEPLEAENEWKSLTSYISEKLDESAEGNFLKQFSFWDDSRLEDLWGYTCDDCGEPCVKKDALRKVFVKVLADISKDEKRRKPKN
ncbi:hypothetical protein BD410DRAFT_783708 [Rickenella mellea]|uniref:BTB domain-containing protein n=1 Tax=Rickenella mellea TaxID=50990 RepID=A0A4Y7QG49_9AGAM|nr:hypothetical protein BD410DRAFT_783708 [Rickenella mellea]